MKNTEALLRLLKSRFNMYYTPNGDETEFLRNVKEQLEKYFDINLNVQIQKIPESIETLRYLRETLLVEIDTLETYVSYPTVIKINKELQGYTLQFRIRGLDHNKMIKLARLAHDIIECQDDVNYPLSDG